MPIEAQTSNEDDERVAAARANLPSIATIINIRDIEAVAEYVLSKQAWSYYRSDAEDGFSKLLWPTLPIPTNLMISFRLPK